MKDDKHTPGPWKHSKASVYIEREFDNDLWVAECRTYEDAEFISSAPTLKSELEAARKEIAELKSQVHALQCMGYDDTKRELWEKACKAQQDIDMFSSTHLRPPLAEYQP